MIKFIVNLLWRWNHLGLRKKSNKMNTFICKHAVHKANKCFSLVARLLIPDLNQNERVISCVLVLGYGLKATSLWSLSSACGLSACPYAHAVKYCSKTKVWNYSGKYHKSWGNTLVVGKQWQDCNNIIFQLDSNTLI